jgi:acyl-ACP thioesterase
MKNICEISHPVAPFETGPEKTIHFHCLMQRLQEAATAHAEREGFGITHLEDKNSFWVLTSIKVEIERLPVQEELFTVKTWAKGVKRLRAFREFLCSTPDEYGIIKASSEWMVLEKETGRPQDINKMGLDLLPIPDAVFNVPCKRLRAQTNVDLLSSKRVPYSVLDSNGHVNNTNYLRWCVDEMRFSGFELEKIKSLRMSFLSELFEGDKVSIYSCETDHEKQNRYQIVRDNDEIPVFALEIECS